ncbi:hypothetical protein [Priestia megaterium]|uniref:hypothetical protein n=1 Tax=Priestia megaterium TaxID=1404 RepID=UPI00272FF12F|nr:hypothetical protein [Priestia megaterium]MDP1441918.1 hypothetical protein [Priestia megaterium]MDP1471017.1 hypothetical protein [Priestia megaterium]
MSMESKLEIISGRALELALENLEEERFKFNDETLEHICKLVVLTSTSIAAQLIAEYDDNKKQGNI